MADLQGGWKIGGVDAPAGTDAAPASVDLGAGWKIGGNAPAQSPPDHPLDPHVAAIQEHVNTQILGKAPALQPNGPTVLPGMPGPVAPPIPFGLSNRELTAPEKAAMPFIAGKTPADAAAFMRDTGVAADAEPMAYPVVEGVGQALGGGWKILTAGPTPTKPADAQQLLSGASDVVEGGFKAVSPLIGVGGAEAPLATLGTLGAAVGADKGVEAGSKALGASPEVSRFAGNVAAVLAGGATGRKAFGKLWEAAGSPEVKIGGKFAEPKPFGAMSDDELVAHANTIERDPPKNYDWQKQEIVKEVAKRQAGRGMPAPQSQDLGDGWTSSPAADKVEATIRAQEQAAIALRAKPAESAPEPVSEPASEAAPHPTDPIVTTYSQSGLKPGKVVPTAEEIRAAAQKVLDEQPHLAPILAPQERSSAGTAEGEQQDSSVGGTGDLPANGEAVGTAATADEAGPGGNGGRAVAAESRGQAEAVAAAPEPTPAIAEETPAPTPPPTESVAEKPQAVAPATAEDRGPGWVGKMSPSEVQVDAPRFQFKADVGQHGASDKLKDAQTYDDEQGGTLAVWKDPADGKTYVVNGHHRLDLANRLNAPEVTVRYLRAKTAQEARLKGAIINIGEDQGSSIDAAKVFRDSGRSVEQLAKDGLVLKGRIASEGLGLSRLSQPIFNDVVAGDLTPARGAVIGRVPNHADQQSLYDLIRQREKGGKGLSDRQVGELIRMNERTGTVTETSEQGGLFGEEEMTRSLLPEKAIVSDYVRQQLAAEKKLFGVVSGQAAADRLGEAGNIIKAGENKQVADSASRGILLYDKLSVLAGPIDTALESAARSIADGENVNAVKQRAYREIRDEVRKQADQLAGVPQGDVRRAEGLGEEGPLPVSAGERDSLDTRGTGGDDARAAGALRPQEVAPAAAVEPNPLKAAAARNALQAAERKAKLTRKEGPFGSERGSFSRKPIKKPVDDRQTSLVSSEDEDASRATTKSNEEKLLGNRLTAQFKSGMAARPSKLKPAQNRGLFEEDGPEQSSLLADFLASEEGSSKVAQRFLDGLAWAKHPKARKPGSAAFTGRLAEQDKQYGLNVREWFTARRDLWGARVNQELSLLRKAVPDPIDQEALSIYREFKSRPGELKQWLGGSHPAYGDVQNLGHARANIEKLRPAIERAMKPSAAMLKADKVLTKIAEVSLAEGQRLGFIDQHVKPEEYVTHLLEPEKEESGPSLSDRVGKALGGKIGRNFPYNQQRNFPTLLDAAANNFKPRTLNAFSAFEQYGDKFATARATHMLIEQLRASNVGIWGSRSDKGIPKDWVEIAPHAHPFRNLVGYTDAEGKPQGAYQTLFVPPAIEAALRPMTDPDYTGKIAGFRKLRVFQSYTKAAQLSLSYFHATSENYMALANMGARGWLQGLKADRFSPEFLEQERDLIGHGGTTSIQGKTYEATSGVTVSSLPTAGEAWKSLPGIRQIDRAAQKITDFTFGRMQRQFKVVDYSIHKAAWLAKHPHATPAEENTALRSIAKEVNAVYGGLHTENVGINKSTLEVARALMLAPDWTFSNIFNLKYATERGTPAGKLARMFWLRAIVGGMVATQAASLMFSRKLSKNPTQAHLGTDQDGKEIYQNLFFKGAPGDITNLVGNVKDYGAVIGLTKTLGGKVAPGLRTGIELLRNEDFLGRKIVPKGMNPVAGTVRAGMHTVRGLAPIPWSMGNVKDMLFGPESHKYKVPLEVLTTLFAGTPPRHVADNKPEKPQQGIWDQIVTGKPSAPATRKAADPIKQMQRQQKRLLK